jgi:hypothetical protein
VLFRISDIIVEGQSRYGAGEIINASGLSRGESLSLSDKGAAARRITEALPYIIEVRIVTKLPGTIILEVHETEELAFVVSGGYGLIIDESCRILEVTDSGDKRGLITVSGIDAVAPLPGKIMSAQPGQETALLYLKEILPALIENNIAAETDFLDISNIGNVNFSYRYRFTVELGSGFNAAQKISTMLSLISQTEPDSKYIVSVKDPDKTTFIKR